MITAIAFFALAAILGMLLLSFVLKGNKTPRAVVFTHGPLAITGVVLLIVYSSGQEPGPAESIILFAIAAAAGIMMVVRDLAGKVVPKWLGIVHGVVAMAGFIMLLVFAFIKPH
jgi:hypothetical protein